MHICVSSSTLLAAHESQITVLLKMFAVILSMQDCIHLCMSVIQTELPDLSALALKINDDDDILLSILMAALAPENKISALKAHSDQRRSYSMEHFRWGKPSGRKRRPVKVVATSLEGGGSSEGGLPSLVRRQLSSDADEAMGDLNGENLQNQGLVPVRVRASSKSHVQLSSQQRKDGTYRMSHFRWGSPPVSKRNGSLTKTWEEKPQRQLAKLFRNIIAKDVQRIMG